MKPILFNTEMVQALLEGRKTQTRRIIKLPKWIEKIDDNSGRFWVSAGGGYDTGECGPQELETIWHISPYHVGDILYVRETWQMIPCIDCRQEPCHYKPITYEDSECVTEGCFVFRADYPKPERMCWRPSLHMPKEAARIFLRVTDVRVERLHEISAHECVLEGVDTGDILTNTPINGNFAKYAIIQFSKLWDSTIKPTEREQFGWEASPWVWVIEFERCEKPAEGSVTE